MEREEIIAIAQLLTGIKDAVDKLEKAKKSKDLEMMANAKREILALQKEVEKKL